MARPDRNLFHLIWKRSLNEQTMNGLLSYFSPGGICGSGIPRIKKTSLSFVLHQKSCGGNGVIDRIRSDRIIIYLYGVAGLQFDKV